MTATFAVAAPKITVQAGDFARQNTIVSFELKNAANKALKSADGAILPLQNEGDTAFFVLPHLEKNASATFEIVDRARNAKRH